jgi:hypothetical protein
MTQRRDAGYWQLGPLAALVLLVALTALLVGYMVGRAEPRIMPLSAWVTGTAAAVVLTVIAIAAAAFTAWRGRRALAAVTGPWRTIPQLVWWAVVVTVVSAPVLWHLPGGAVNLLTDLWGLALAGVEVWWFQARWSPAIERQVWLRKHAAIVNSALSGVCIQVAVPLEDLLRLPKDDVKALQLGATTAARKKAVERARALIHGILNCPIDSSLMDYWQTSEPLASFLRDLAKGTESIERYHPAVFDQLPEIHEALNNYRNACSSFGFLRQLRLNMKEQTGEDRLALSAIPAVGVASRALEICELCADALVEAGTLPAR